MYFGVGDNVVKVMLILYILWVGKWGIFGFCVFGVVDVGLVSWWGKGLLRWWFVVGLRGWFVILELKSLILV